MRTSIVFLMTCFILSSATAQELSVMTYNIRYATERDGENQWEARKDYLSNQIRFYEPDVFGIQEGLTKQVGYLDEQLTEYGYVGVGRDDGKMKGEYTAIFYNRDVLELLAHETFWLSETPDKVSVGWDASMERICTYALFMDKTSGISFWLFNTHFDHIGKKAREKSAELIIDKIKAVNKDSFPVILMGDFNLNDQSKPISRLSSYLNDTRLVSENKPFGPFGTFTGFKFDEPVKDRIDYIFTSQNTIKVKKYAVLTDSKDLKYPSDHLPVFVKIQLIQKK